MMGVYFEFETDYKENSYFNVLGAGEKNRVMRYSYLLAPRISRETTGATIIPHPLNYPDATVKMKALLPNAQLLEKGKYSNNIIKA